MPSKRFLFATIFFLSITAISVATYLYFANQKPALAAGTTINAASCSQADVQTAINLASAGDTVNVPAGNCTWSLALNINKAITLQGAGYIQTVINNNAGGTLIRISSTNDSLVRVSGFKFDQSSNLRSENIISIIGLAIKVRVDHNWFEKGGWAVSWNSEGWAATGPVEGVIDHNTFMNQIRSIRPADVRAADRYVVARNGDVGIDGGTSWSEPVQAGSGHFMFVEDNNFLFDSNYPLSAYCQFAGCGQFSIYGDSQGGSLVLRYNNFSGYNAPYFDGHGDSGVGGKMYSTKFYDIYRNTFRKGTAGDGSGGGIGDMRGGSLLIWENYIDGAYGQQPVQLTNYFGEDGYGHILKDTYLWDNKDLLGNNYSGTMAISWNPHPDFLFHTPPVYNTDYFFRAPNLPSDKFYGYIPYTYPHPLTVDSTPPPSQNFSPNQIIEAESGQLTSMQIGTSGSDTYIYTLTNNIGSAKYTFDIPISGQYRMEAKVNSNNDGAQNSFYIGLDSESAQGNNTYSYSLPLVGSFTWDDVNKVGNGTSTPQFDPMTWNLTQGTHSFTFYGRESNTWLDQIRLVSATTDTTPPSAPTGLIVN